MFNFLRQRAPSIPYSDEFVDLRFPEQKFGRRIRTTDLEQQQSLLARQRQRLIYVENSDRCRKARIWSICALRRRTRGLTIAERAAVKRRKAREQIVSQAIDRLDDLCDAETDELRCLVQNPDTPPLVSFMAEQALRSRR